MAPYPDGSSFIDGRFGAGTGEELTVIDPSTGKQLWSYRADEPETVSRAIDAAAAAFPGWSGSTPAERSGVLLALARELAAVAEDLAQTETAQAGKPIRLSREFDVPGSIDNVEFFAGAARHLEGRSSGEYSPDHTSRSAARRSVWSGRSRRGTTRCRWRCGRSCRRSRPATRSC